MSKIDSIVTKMRRSPRGIRFNELSLVCEHYFGPPRQKGSSHKVYKTPWRGNPRVNIQNHRGKAKAYQVRQVLEAIERLE
ncbi:toxin HicA [Seongchinamella unica]|uniref:Toxin HicA n=1 Tax=Seongchinamella unica TaxID=2547392 RepID=A0A4R5LQP6_9GAMM|nr:toxin HicA [Seongchinamella unica]